MAFLIQVIVSKFLFFCKQSTCKHWITGFAAYFQNFLKMCNNTFSVNWYKNIHEKSYIYLTVFRTLHFLRNLQIFQEKLQL